MHTIKHVAGFYNTTNTYHSLLRVYYESMKTITYLHRRLVIKQEIPKAFVPSIFLYSNPLSFTLIIIYLRIKDGNNNPLINLRLPLLTPK